MNLLDIKILNTAIERELNRGMANYNLTYTQASVLGFLYAKTKAEICQKDIEFHLGLAHPTVSSILQRLEEKGLIETVPLDSDRRFKRIIATEKSIALRGRVESVVDTIAAKLLRGLPGKQHEQFARIVSHMINNLTG